MSIVNHIDKNNPSATLKDSLLTASNYLLYGFIIASKHSLKQTVYSSGVTQHRNWGKLTQSTITAPSGVVLRHMDLFNFDKYNFEIIEGSEDNFLFADYLVLDSNITLTQFDPTDNLHVVPDILASCIHNMLLQNIQMAYAYLSYLQVYIQLVLDVQDDEVEPERTEVTIQPYEL